MSESSDIPLSDEGLTGFQSLGAILASTILVGQPAPVACRSDVAAKPCPPQGKGAERQNRSHGSRKKRSRKKKSGWPALTGMRISDVKRALRVNHAARRARRTPNYLVTVNPPAIEGETTRERAKRISRVPERMRHGLSRRGQDDIAITTREWPTDGRLHGHTLLFVAPENDDYMARWHNPPDVHIRAAVPTDIEYITKERLRSSQEFEAGWNHKRVKAGVKFKGQRLFISPAAQALLELRTKSRHGGVAAGAATGGGEHVPEPIRATITYEMNEVGQGLLFDMPPVLVSLDNYRGGKMPAVVAAQVEVRRRELELTQRELGARTGLSQPQIANVVAGRFGLSRHAATRLRAVLNKAAA